MKPLKIIHCDSQICGQESQCLCHFGKHIPNAFSRGQRLYFENSNRDVSDAENIQVAIPEACNMPQTDLADCPAVGLRMLES